MFMAWLGDRARRRQRFCRASGRHFASAPGRFQCCRLHRRVCGAGLKAWPYTTSKVSCMRAFFNGICQQLAAMPTCSDCSASARTKPPGAPRVQIAPQTPQLLQHALGRTRNVRVMRSMSITGSAKPACDQHVAPIVHVGEFMAGSRPSSIRCVQRAQFACRVSGPRHENIKKPSTCSNAWCQLLQQAPSRSGRSMCNAHVGPQHANPGCSHLRDHLGPGLHANALRLPPRFCG